MALRFRKSIRLAPGVRLNIGKSGLGISAGVKGARVGVGTRGAYTSVGIPGTGISMLKYHGKPKGQAEAVGSIMSEFGEISVSHTARGIPRFELELSHEGLSKFQVIKGDSPAIVEQKACAKMEQWNEMWRKHLAAENKRIQRQENLVAKEEKKALAAERTVEAQEALNALGRVLSDTLDVNDTVEWESLKGSLQYPEPHPPKPVLPPQPVQPSIPPKPKRADPNYAVRLGALDKLLKSRAEKKASEAEARFLADHAEWEKHARKAHSLFEAQKQDYIRAYQSLKQQYERAIQEWKERRAAYVREQEQRNAQVDAKRGQYFSGDPVAIEDYCELVLANSEYPASFPQSYETQYVQAAQSLVVDYQLPAPEDLPALREVKYVQTTDELVEKDVSQTQVNKNFASVAFQIAIRTVHELFEADQANVLRVVVFNGFIATVDSGTGEDIEVCILSLRIDKAEFLRMNLARVEPSECFARLGGEAKSPLHKLLPVTPKHVIVSTDAE